MSARAKSPGKKAATAEPDTGAAAEARLAAALARAADAEAARAHAQLERVRRTKLARC